MSDKAAIRARFDRLLSSYQKISLFLLLPPLLSAFSTVVRLLNANYGLALAMALPQGLLAYWDPLFVMILALGILGATVPLSLFAAKGKLWCFLIGMGLYLADFIYGFFIFGTFAPLNIWLFFGMHILFLVVEGLGIFFYIRADRLLKAHPKDILGESR